MKWIILILILIGLFFLIGAIKNAQNPGAANFPTPSSVSSNSNAPTAPQSSGVPVSADDFLRGR